MPRRRKDASGKERKHKCSKKENPVQRNAANARERTRMRVLSRAFSRLKTTLPWVPADTKLSKLDTLRLAASYIAHLKGVLRDETPLSSTRQLSWPFSTLHTALDTQALHQEAVYCAPAAVHSTAYQPYPSGQQHFYHTDSSCSCKPESYEGWSQVYTHLSPEQRESLSHEATSVVSY